MIFSFALLSALLSCSCNQYDDEKGSEENIIFETDTNKYVDLESGVFGLVGKDTKKYDPINPSK